MGWKKRCSCGEIGKVAATEVMGGEQKRQWRTDVDVSMPLDVRQCFAVGNDM